MFGIAVIDVPNLTARYVRSALPQSPVIEGERRRRLVVAARAERR
jgi:hypothetical protein